MSAKYSKKFKVLAFALTLVGAIGIGAISDGTGEEELLWRSDRNEELLLRGALGGDFDGDDIADQMRKNPNEQIRKEKQLKNRKEKRKQFEEYMINGMSASLP
ncbi:hypothetical protein QYF36_003575 [Acer negundo]|nr:hypothetical protein QYF36_003575 [Acer negundo]